jgi:hypothetical protein
MGVFTKQTRISLPRSFFPLALAFGWLAFVNRLMAMRRGRSPQDPRRRGVQDLRSTCCDPGTQRRTQCGLDLDRAIPPSHAEVCDRAGGPLSRVIVAWTPESLGPVIDASDVRRVVGRPAHLPSVGPRGRCADPLRRSRRRDHDIDSGRDSRSPARSLATSPRAGVAARSTPCEGALKDATPDTRQQGLRGWSPNRCQSARREAGGWPRHLPAAASPRPRLARAGRRACGLPTEPLPSRLVASLLRQGRSAVSSCKTSGAIGREREGSSQRERRRGYAHGNDALASRRAG